VFRLAILRIAFIIRRHDGKAPTHPECRSSWQKI
jgi:hypothetical protein